MLDGPDQVTYHVVFEDGRVVASALGDLRVAEVTLRMSDEDSVAIPRGDLDPNAACGDRRIGFGGDMLWP